MPLEPGTRIGRIVIESLLGTGGMGEVYRGWDEKLERAVALKLVHTDKRFSTEIRGRFLREARVLSKLDHPNICRIYDVLERENADYLVLELVDGTTLREHIGRIGRDQTLDVALQVARVLAATHARGIVHRDLKPDNIMLTPAGDVKVLDFGLARPVAPESGGALELAAAELLATDDVEKTAVLGRPQSSTAGTTHTSAGSLVGTLHYMSPEQARGLPIGEASDVYSLGIVLHELLTGGRAIYGDVDSMNDLLMRVRQAEIDLTPVVDRPLVSLLRRMLALYPADRPTATDLVRELERIRARPALIRRRAAIAAAVLAVVTLLGGTAVMARRLAESRALFDARSGGRVAILPFRNATGDASLRWMENGLAEFVSEGVRRTRGVDVVPTEDVSRALAKIGNPPAIDDAHRRTLLRTLGADVLIAPAVVSDDGKYTIRYAALTTDRAEEPREATSTVLIEAARQMTVALVQRIDPAASAAVIRSRYSLDNTANLLYAIGLQELRARGPLAASKYFAVCIDRDPSFLAARMQLADCLKAMAENDDEAATLLATAIDDARKRGDDEMLVRGLITRSRWAIEDGEYPLAHSTAREALDGARRMGDRELVARAHNAIGYASWRTGDLSHARQEFEAALRIAVERRDLHQQADLHNDLGVLASSADQLDLANQHYATAMQLAEQINDRYMLTTVIGNLANGEGDAGRFARAEALTRRQLELTREIRDTATEIFALTNLGLWQWAQGHELEAVKTTEEAAAVAARVANPRVEAVILANLGTAHAKLGNLADANRFALAAREKSRSLDDPEVERDVELALAYVRIREGRLAEAATAIDRAERWRTNGRTRLMRGRLAYARGDYASAAGWLRRAKATGDSWLVQHEQMLQAFEESARTRRPSTLAFESPVR